MAIVKKHTVHVTKLRLFFIFKKVESNNLLKDV